MVMDQDTSIHIVGFVPDNHSEKRKKMIDRMIELENEYAEIWRKITEEVREFFENACSYFKEINIYPDLKTDRMFGYSVIPKYKSQVLDRKPIFIRARSNC